MRFYNMKASYDPVLYEMRFYDKSRHTTQKCASNRRPGSLMLM